MTEREYEILTAPMDLTKEDIQERGKGRKATWQKRGDKNQDAKKPLQPEIETPVWYTGGFENEEIRIS